MKYYFNYDKYVIQLLERYHFSKEYYYCNYELFIRDLQITEATKVFEHDNKVEKPMKTLPVVSRLSYNSKFALKYYNFIHVFANIRIL